MDSHLGGRLCLKDKCAARWSNLPGGQNQAFKEPKMTMTKNDHDQKCHELSVTPFPNVTGFGLRSKWRLFRTRAYIAIWIASEVAFRTVVGVLKFTFWDYDNCWSIIISWEDFAGNKNIKTLDTACGYFQPEVYLNNFVLHILELYASLPLSSLTSSQSQSSSPSSW